jgi:hypothetical protein
MSGPIKIGIRGREIFSLIFDLIRMRSMNTTMSQCTYSARLCLYLKREATVGCWKGEGRGTYDSLAYP